MAKRLTDGDKAHRIVSSLNLRKLLRKGRCYNTGCRREVEKGEYSLRFVTIVHGRSQEVGICVECAARIWPEIEDIIGRLSLQMDEMRRELDGGGDVLPPTSEEMAEMQDEVYKGLGIDESGASGS